MSGRAPMPYALPKHITCGASFWQTNPFVSLQTLVFSIRLKGKAEGRVWLRGEDLNL